MEILANLTQLDQQLFLFLNSTCSNVVFDTILPLCREKLFWVPLYLFIFLCIWRNFAWRYAFLLVFGLLLCVTIADTVSSKLVKPTFQRLRPCRTEILQSAIQPRVPCGSGYSFTSSHATNHFAAAMFLGLVLGRRLPNLKYFLYFWAGTVAFAQVYVGVHYPFDVLCGALLGMAIGWVVYWVTCKFIPGND